MWGEAVEFQGTDFWCWVHAAEITSEIKLACSEAKGTLYRVQPTDVCFSMTISRGFFSRIFDQDTSPEFCQLNHSLFPNVECATVKCLAPTGCGAAGGPPCTTDCGNALFGAICRTLQPNFLVCLPPNQYASLPHPTCVLAACSSLGLQVL